MILTVPNHEIGATEADDDCIAVTFLSATAQQAIQPILAELSRQLDGSIWPMPLSALHVTLCEIVQPKAYIEDKAVLLAQVPAYAQVLRTVLDRPAITVRFDTIEVSQHAIIIRGQDDGSFADIRQQLVRQLPLPRETKQPPPIIHSTIARFTKQIDVEIVRAVAAKCQIDFTEHIRQFQLLTQTVPHLMRVHVARRYDLN